MYESMSDVDTGTAPCPTAAQLSGGQFWSRGANTATAKTWTLVGDGRFFFFFTQQGTSTGHYPHLFGDIVSYRAADAYGCILGGHSSAVAGGTSSVYDLATADGPGDSPGNYGYVLSRISAQTGACIRANHITLNEAQFIGGTGMPSYPSPVDNGVVIVRPIYIGEENAAFVNPIRGETPGMMAPLASSAFSNHLELVAGITGFSGSALVISIGTNTTAARWLLDISNSWR
jgi:hypothetical protein